MTASVDTIAKAVFDCLEDNNFDFTLENSAKTEFEFTKYHNSGNYSVVEVFVNHTSVEIYRGEFNKSDMQLGAKGTVTLTAPFNEEARHLIARKAS